MSTYDHMTAQEYQDCVDAGRGPGPDVREQADLERKARREGPTDRWMMTLVCGHLIVSDTHETGSTYCPACGMWNSIQAATEYEDEDV